MLQGVIRLYKQAYGGLPTPIWWLAVVMLVNRSGTMVIPFLTVYLTGIGYSMGEAGFVMALFGMGALLGGYAGGWLADRIGYFYVQVASLLVSGVLFIVLGYLHKLWQIAGCIFLLSIFNEAFRPANAAAIALYSTIQNRTRCYSLNRLATNLGWAVGPAIGGLLAGINYQLLFWTDGLTCLVASLLLYVFLKNESRPVPEQAKSSRPGNAYTDFYFIRGLVLLLLVVVCFFQLFSILPVFYKNVVHLSESAIGLILALNGLLIVAVEMVMVYRLELRYKDLYLMITGALLIGGAFLLLMISPVLSVVVLSMVVITFGEMFLFPFSNKFWIARSNAQNRGQYAALYTMTFAMAHVLAPGYSTHIAERWGFEALFLFNFFICLSAAVGFYFLSKQETKYGTI